MTCPCRKYEDWGFACGHLHEVLKYARREDENWDPEDPKWWDSAHTSEAYSGQWGEVVPVMPTIPLTLPMTELRPWKVPPHAGRRNKRYCMYTWSAGPSIELTFLYTPFR